MAAITKPGRYSDGGNLYLRVLPNGSKNWSFMFSLPGGPKNREVSFGSAAAGAVTLAEARQRADAARKQLEQGVAPTGRREAARAAASASGPPTFARLAAEYIRDHEAGWSNRKHIAQWRSTLLGPRYCSAIQDKAVDAIDVEDVLGVLRPIWHARPETARRIRMRIEAVIDAASVRGLRSGENPARWRGHLAHLLPRHGRETKHHHPALPWREVPAFMVALRSRPGIAARALEYAILTAARSGEVRGMEWAEVDLDERVWTVPAARMKARREHRGPLSSRAIEIIEEMRPLRPKDDDGSALVFPGAKKGAPLSDMSLSATLRRMGQGGITVHGFRSSFRDWTSEATNYPGAVAEAALAHTIENKVEAAYRRGDLLERRRALMDDWCRYLDTPADADNVVRLDARGKRT